LAAIVLQLTLAAAAAAFEFDAVLVGGRPDGDSLGPQLGSGIDWDNGLPKAWLINQAGQVTFNQELSDNVADAEDRTFFRWSAGGKELLVREGAAAPGFPEGVTFRTVDTRHDLADDGSVLIDVALQGTGVTSANDETYLHFAPANATSTPMREGASAPCLLPFVTFGFPSTGHRGTPNLWPDGQILMYGKFGGPGVITSNDEGLFFGPPSGLQLLFREGATAADADPGSIYRDVFGFNYAAAGDFVAISTRLRRADGSVTPALYIVDSASSEFSLIATDQTPNGLGETFDSFYAFSDIQVNGSGRAIFSQETGAGTNGLYAYASDSITPIAVTGDLAPGADANFDAAVMPSSVLTKSGHIAFYHSLSGPTVNAANDRGIWINDAGGTRLAIREGDAASGLPDVNIGTIASFAFNDGQNLAVLADLRGSVAPDDNHALWLVRPNGDLELIARKGDVFDVDPTPAVDERTILGIFLDGHSLTGSNRAKLNVLNDSDQLAFGLTFTDGHSGIFVADVSPAGLLGDFDDDGRVDGQDFLLWQRGQSPNPFSSADLADWQANFGTTPSLDAVSSAVPEPTTLALTTFFAVALATGRRRQR
jgi:hypothetical protein